jgi:glucose/arabinose dehydrogenase
MRYGLLVKIFSIVFGLSAVTAPAWGQFPGIRLSVVARGFVKPTFITNAGDGSGRLFVVEQRGVVRIIMNGAVLPTPFLNISDRVLAGGERGLLNITFPPQPFPSDHFYVNYTRSPDGATVVARYDVTADPNVGNPASEEVLLVVSQPFANHNGGMMAFSPFDGFLYIALGDGGSSGDPRNFAQNLNLRPGNRHFLGKILRIDVESGTVPYAVPATNPVILGTQSEIWAWGLRNPWRFSFDRVTGDLYIGDVGQSRVEEIDFQPAASTGGENYGWRIFEGTLCFNPPVGCVEPPLFVPPVTQYSHTAGCSVTAGYVYRGAEFPSFDGLFFLGDFCTGLIWGLRPVATGFKRRLLKDTSLAISTFGEGEDGSIYVTDYATGVIHKIIETVTVLTPNGGETIPAGTQRLIEWSKGPEITAVNLHFSVNNGLTWRLIERNVQENTFLWDVPVLGKTKTACRIRVTGLDGAGKQVGRDRSDKVFTIQRIP